MTIVPPRHVKAHSYGIRTSMRLLTSFVSPMRDPHSLDSFVSTSLHLDTWEKWSCHQNFCGRTPPGSCALPRTASKSSPSLRPFSSRVPAAKASQNNRIDSQISLRANRIISGFSLITGNEETHIKTCKTPVDV